jgi:D-psicose/D-tagatose/L-ribulose 3-epimerase
MLFGLCLGDPARIPQLPAWGYDYAEIGARTVLPFEDKAAWQPRRRELAALGVPMTHLAGFIPAELPFVGPDVEWPRLESYLETVVGRASELGVRTFNWGSAVARKVPHGWDYSRAHEQLERLGRFIGPLMERHDATCVIEAVNPRECNLVYYLTDALALAESTGSRRIGVIPDYYHMALQNEPVEHVTLVRDRLWHAHTSGPERHFPKPDDGFDHAAFLRALKDVGYDRTLSFECSRVPSGADYAEEARAGAAYIRELYART